MSIERITHNARSGPVRRLAAGLLFSSILILSGLPACSDATCEDCAATEVANEGWNHVAEGSSITYFHNPPASGSHYPVWARWEAYDEVIPRGYWVHNVEHGGLVLLYRPDAEAAAISALRALYDALPSDPQCGFPRAILTPDPELDSAVAAVVADHVLEDDEVTEDAVNAMYERCRCTLLENVCVDGDYPYGGI